MSSNLYKRRLTNVQQEDVRVIEVNALIAKRIEALGIRMQHPVQDGFVAGIQVQSMDADELAWEDGDDGCSGNVIKAHIPEESVEEQATKLKQEAERLLEETQAQAQQMLMDAKRQAETEKHSILEEARRQGYEDGMQRASQEASRLEQELLAKQATLEEEYQRIIDELEPQFIDLITGIYEHVFHVELRSYREILVYLISATMRKIDGNRFFCVHVSKEDYPYVSMQKKQIAAGVAVSGSSVEIVEDITLSKNECLIETENGIFDCGLGTQLSELKKRLMILAYEK